MNKFHRVIWNRATRQFVVASELASSRSGGSAARLAAPLLITLLLPVNALAERLTADGTLVVAESGSSYDSLEAINGGEINRVQVTGSEGVNFGAEIKSGAHLDVTDSTITINDGDAGIRLYRKFTIDPVATATI